MKKIILGFLLSSIISSCSFLQEEKETDNKTEKPNDEIVIEHSYDEVKSFLLTPENVFEPELDEYYVYYFSQSCSHCEDLKNWIIEKALERGDIFFVQSGPEVIIKNDINSSIGATFAGDICILGYPSIVEILDKKVVKNVAGKDQIIQLLNF